MIETPLRGRAVMVVEDEYFQADDLSFTFAEAGAVLVGPFATVDAALTALAGHQHIDAAVLDVNLRGVPVSALVAGLIERGIPFLFATGYDRDVLPPEWQGVPVFEKPFNTRKLVEAVAVLVGTSAARGQNALSR